MVIVSDPIGDLLTRLRNAQRARRQVCLAPWSKIKLQLMELLKREGYIKDVKVTGEEPKLWLEVTFSEDHPNLELKRVSKPGRRVYSPVTELKPVMSGFGCAVLTTSHGLLTDKEARAKKAGGEVLCTVS